MRTQTIVTTLVAALAAASCTTPRDVAIGEEATIPFPETGIRSWHADDDRSLWVLDNRDRWYRVELMQPCIGLPFAYALGFDTRTPGRFDRFSAILYDGQRCQVSSIKRSAPPPTKEERRKAQEPAPEE